MFRRFKVCKQEQGLLFKDGEFAELWGPGRYTRFDPLFRLRLEKVTVTDPWFSHAHLDVILRSGALEGRVQVVDLKAHERALVWVDGRFAAVLRPGRYVLWTVFRQVRVDVLEALDPRLDRRDLPVVLGGAFAREALETVSIEPHAVGVYFRDGEFAGTLGPGLHAFWKEAARVRVIPVDLREQALEIGGQEIMTADKVTLRLNAVLSFRVADARKAVAAVEDFKQAIYREAQLALRASVGARELEGFLTSKDALAREVEGFLKNRMTDFGMEVLSFGVKDVILPGEMKDLMNKVTEAKKAAEAALITRREETAALRMQANSAKVIEGNPVLMRLRELEVLEKVADKAKFNIVLGDKGLAQRVVNVL